MAGEIEVIPAKAVPIRPDPGVDIQVATAKRYPRSISKAIKSATEMACLTQDIAESCIYAIPRGGKTIDGPSVRLAEIVATCWGNLRVEAQPLDEGSSFVEAAATAWDLEANLAVRVMTKRRILDKNGKRYNDDMIGVTANAAVSIALRNAVFRVVPRSVIETVYQSARQAAGGTQRTLAARRDRALASFAKMGVGADRIFARLGKQGIEDVGLDDLALLFALHNQIREGDASIDDVFPAPGSTPT